MKNLMFICFITVTFSAWSQNQFQNESSGSLAFTSGRLIQLAEAFPESDYGWKPSDDSRSFGQVLSHVISANYFFAMKMGATIPETVNMQTIEKDLKTKEDLIQALKDSYQLIIATTKNIPADKLSAKVEFPFPGEFTTMTAALIGISHTNEHLGQLIAYSRSNNITPPWSE